MQPPVAEEVWPQEQEAAEHIALQSGSTEQWLLLPTPFYSDLYFIFIQIKGVSHYLLDLLQH